MTRANQMFSFFLIFLACTVFGNETKRSHTFMKSHQADRHTFLHQNPTSTKKSSFTATGFFFDGLKHAKTAKPFLIDRKETLLIQGDDVPLNFNRDVRAEWLGLPSNFNSEFSMQPTAQQGGMIFEHDHNLFKLTGFSLFKNTNLCIRVPLMHVTHSLHMNGDAQLINALNNPTWQNLSFVPVQKKWGIGDITLFSKTSFSREYVTFTYYSGVIIPTGQKYSNEQFFPVQFGNNRRLGLNGGIDIKVTLNKQPSAVKAVVFANLDACYLLRTFRKRTFNLKEKPWSSFMLFNDARDPSKKNIPGVNALTYEAHIKPNSLADFSMGFDIGNKYISCIVGYNVWGYEGEHIEHVKHFKPDSFGIASSVTDDIPTSASRSTISQQADPDETFTSIKELDIDLKSGAHPSVLNHGIFATTTAHIETDFCDAYITFGAVGEFPQKKGICPLWGIWSNIIISL